MPVSGTLTRRTVPHGLFKRSGKAFSPLDIANLKTWLQGGVGLFTDTARTTPATADNAQVAAWADQSGQGNHLTQATGGNRPTLKLTEGLNGYPALRFTRASSQYLSGPTLTLAQPNTMFIVAKVISGSGGNNSLIGSTTSVQNALFVQGAVSEHLGIFDGATTQSSAAGYADDWYIFGHQAKVDPDLAFVNGVQVISGASGSDALGGVRIGANVTPANFLGGWVLEFLVYNAALSSTERAQVVTYLDNKYGISGVAPLSVNFPFLVFEDLNVRNTGNLMTMVNDARSFGMDGVLFTNGNTTDLDAFGAILDAQGIPMAGGFVAELNVSNSADLTPLAGKLRRHRSIIAYAPNRDEPPASDASFITSWVSSLRTIDPRRPSSVMLAGTDRVQPIYDAALPGWLLIDAYPCVAGRSEMDFTHIFGYASLDLESYVKLVTQSKKPTTPLIVTFQAHGSVAFGLRQPTAAEIRRQFWELIGLGTNGLSPFIYGTQQDWVGLDTYTAGRNELLALSANLTPTVRSALWRQVRCLDEWIASNGVKCYTTSNLNADGTALGDTRQVTVVNRTLSPVTTTITALLGPNRNLTRLTDGVVTNTVTLPAGGGAIFQTTPQTQAAGVPDVPIDWTQTSSARWAAHPLNETVNGAYTVATHPVGAHITVGQTRDDIQAAIDGLPLGPATILIDSGTYTIPTTSPLRLYGKSNLHFVANGGQVTFVPGGSVPAAPTVDYKSPYILIGPSQEWIEPSTAYADFNAAVDIGTPKAVNDFRHPCTDILFKGITFDGGARLTRPLTFTSCRRVMFDSCIWTNLRDSYEASAGADGFHWGSITGNTRMEQIYFRNCTFNGPGRWGIYLDGAHGTVVVGSTFAGSSYGGGCFVWLTNDDFSYSDTIAAHVAVTSDEMRSAQYCIFANNTVAGSIDAITSYSGGNILVTNNTINQVHIAFGQTARGSNKWAPITGLVYYHYGNAYISNTIATVVAGPENGAQGILYGGASHCGVDNTPSGTWASPQGRTIWGRVGTGVDPLVPGITKQLTIRNNVVATGPIGLVLLNPDNVPGEPGPAGTLEGAHDLGGNTRNGSPLT